MPAPAGLKQRAKASAPDRLTFAAAISLALKSHVELCSHLIGVMRVGWFWLTLFATLSLSLNYALWPAEYASWDEPNIEAQLLIVFMLILTTLFGSLLAVPLHRRILLDEAMLVVSPIRAWPAVQTYYALSLLILMTAVTPVLIASWLLDPNIDIPGFFIATLLATPLLVIYLGIRMTLIFPTLALDRPSAEVNTAWERTRWQTLAILVGGLVTALPSIAVTALLFVTLPDAYFAQPEDRGLFAVTSTIYEIAWMLTGLVTVTYLALLYRRMMLDTGVEAAPR
ncbi:MAG: hypothetical protein AAGG72_01070 [Pseudomonadota bacterium]